MNELAKVAAIADKGITTAENHLSLLFRQVMYDMSIDTADLTNRLKLYDNDPNHRVPNNKMTRARRRSANIRAVANPRISWKMFCRGLRLLSARKWTLHLHHHSFDGRTRTSSINNTENLATLFLRIRESKRIDDNSFDRMLNKWYLRPDQQDLIKRHRGRKPKGNLERGLVSGTLTWSFFTLGLILTDIEYVTIELCCEWIGNQPSNHVVVLQLGDDVNNVKYE